MADSEGLLTGSLFVHREQQGHIDLAEMRSALDRLPDHQREAIILVAAEGLSYEDVAQICQCATGTIQSRVNRARKQLADLLFMSNVSEYGPDDHIANIIKREVSTTAG